MLIAGLLQFVAAPAATSLPGLPASEKPVKGSHSIKVKPRAKANTPRVPAASPRRAWPKAATDTVDLPKSAGSSGSKPALTAAKGQPVKIGAAKGKSGAKAASSPAVPSAVTSQVLGRKQTERDQLLLPRAPRKARQGVAYRRADAIAPCAI